MDHRARRAAENENAFRELNEGLDELVAGRPGPAAYYCECADETCDRPLVLDRGEYREVRSDPRHFLVAPGHAEGEFEIVLEDRGRYLIVRKTGEAGEVAEEGAGGRPAALSGRRSARPTASRRGTP